MSDFIVRCGYQLGKTPVLPIFAAGLGADHLFLGFIVSASTLTGIVIKPLAGFFSDKWGRRLWLMIGTTIFAGMPFMYWLINTPDQLFVIRLLHGLATAIYGPVTLAYVAELSSENRAERLGWFSTARGSSYIVGPLVGGSMLAFMDPVAIFTVIGILSISAFIPLVWLPDTRQKNHSPNKSLISHGVQAFKSCGSKLEVWVSGGLNAQVLIGKYAAKTFLPLQALEVGISPPLIGLFF